MTKRSVSGWAVALATLALAGCSSLIPAGGSSTPPTSSSEAGASASPETPVPTITQKQTSEPVSPIETHKPTGLPSTCDELGTDTSRAATVDTLEHFPDVPVPTIIQGADVLVSCSWFAGDVTGVDIVIATVQEHDAVAVLDDAAAQGFTCAGEDGYTLCRLDEQATYADNSYPVTSFYLYGSGVWLESVGSNVDVTTWIDDIATSIWQ